MSRVIVIGGGASGMMAAISAAESGHEVILLEQNEKLGKKIYITGKGRCNLTNAADMETVRAHVVTNAKFLYSAFASFDNQDIIRLLDEEGCRTKVERGNRVFPVSDHASDVIRALQKRLERDGVEIRLNTKVSGILTEGGRCLGVECYPLAPAGPGGRLFDRRRAGSVETLSADAVIVATGGQSYPSTGSTGDGYRFAAEARLEVTPRRPALVPFTVREPWVRDLQGLSLRNVLVTVQREGKTLYKEFGEMLFTHFGVSGPALISASSVVGGALPAALSIDLKPALTEEQLDQRILRDFAGEPNKQLQNVLGRLYPAKLVPVMIRLAELDPEKRVHEITKKERQRLLERTKHLEMELTALRGFEEAIVTQGGVSVKEVRAATMESRQVRGLYFAGEVLDVDAMTGGYNLQIAWSTGYLAGQSIRWE